jgi:hypothetical protein
LSSHKAEPSSKDPAVPAVAEDAIELEILPSESGSVLVARLKQWTGVDRAIAFTVMARFWSAFAGVVTILLIAKFLTPSEQGYYYTFSSLVALQIIFELGFSFVVLQLATHERAKLTIFDDGHIEGNSIAHARLASVLQKSVRWYCVAATLMACTLLPAGIYFFTTHHNTATLAHAWRLPWIILVFAATATFQIDPIISFLEGCGYVADVARMRLTQAMVASSLAWSALLLHHGLFAPAMVITGQAVVGLGWILIRRRRLIFGLLRHKTHGNQIVWRSEVWSFQWRIAISWLCGYFIYQLFNPIIFAYQGPVVAGRMGMSLSISGSIGAVAIAWMNTKSSPFGHIIAQGKYRELDHLFFRTLKQSTIFLLAGITTFFSCLLYAARHYPKYADRVLTPWAFAFLLLGVISNHIVTSEALYLRAHKQEPFLIVSVIGAILITISIYFLGRYESANAVAVGYFLCSWPTGLMGSYIFITKRRAWHMPA